MIKLNKCRTLYAFNETSLASLQSQQSQQNTVNSQSTENNQTDKNEQEVNRKNDNTKNEPKEQNVKKNAQNEANKSTAETQAQNTNKSASQSKTNEESQQISREKPDNEEEKTQQQQSQYLYFNVDEFLITLYQYENGWWYGYKDVGESEAEKKMGFFPSNYVQVIEDYAEQIQAQQAEIDNMKASADMDQAFTWGDYAKHSYLDENQILIEERTKILNDPRAPQNRNPDGILGYKKIKIHESRSHAVNPHKGGVVQMGQIAIKDQSQVGKAYRQMNHYFDYDAWIEQMNSKPVAKAKPDVTRKKAKKKALNW